MDSERARQLLGRERDRIEKAIAALSEESGAAVGDQDEPGELGSEELYEKELERAEARLAAGSYGLSVDSGEPIPDARLEALPTAERTLEEQQTSGH